MVLNFADLEINFQSKWLFRPRQRDGVKVEDYYTQFCVWRQEMVSLSFPAEEEDYIAGFIDNLRWDIRWRLSKYECSRYRLTNAFYNAKFVETSLSIEDSMKRIMAHRVFDDMPSRTPISLGGENADCNDEGENADCNDNDISEVDSESNEHQQNLGYEGCEPNVHEVEAFVATPIAGISVASNYAIKFEGATHDISFDGRENVMESDACSEVCKVLDELPDSEEIQDLDVIMGNDPSIEETGPNRGNKDDTGLQVLSIYCAHMALKWNSILELRPKQSKDMSVEVYYDLFFNWKLQLDKVNYIGGEESYVDDFLYGLEIKLGMRVWGYKWKPCTLYGAFRRAVIEEIMMKNEADMALEEMPHPKSIDNPSAEYVSDVCDDVRDASLGGEFAIKVSLIEEDNESSQLLFQNPIRLNEGNVVDGGVVLSLFDLQAYLSPLGDLTANGSWNCSTKAWYDDATSTMKIFSGKRVMEDDAYKVFGEMTRTIQAALLDEQVINNYAKFVDFNKLILFDPGGSRKCVVSFGREVACLLFGITQEMFIFGFKGITLARKHANSFINTWEMLGLLVSLFAENEWGLAGLSSHSNNNLVYTIFGKGENIYSVNDMFMFVFDPGGCLLDLLGTSSVTSWVVLQNINPVKPIIPHLLCAQVSLQRMFSMKAYNITVLLKGGVPLRKMVNRFVIIQASLLMSIICYLSSGYSFQLGEQVHFHIIMSDLVLRSFYVVLDGHGVSKTYEKNNVGRIALVILEYFVDAITIIVLAVLDGFVWDPGEDVIPFYILEGKDVVERVQEDLSKEALKHALGTFKKRHSVEESDRGLAFIDLSKPFVSKLLVVKMVEIRALQAHRIKYFLIISNTAIPFHSARNCGCEELCLEAMDETIENSLKLFVGVFEEQGNVQFMIRIREVCYHICNLFDCSCYNKSVDLLRSCFLSMSELGHVPSTPNFNCPGNKKYLDMVEYMYIPECNVSSVIPTCFGDTHSSLVECYEDYVTDITPLHFDEAWLVVRIGNYEMPWSFEKCSKATFFRLKLSCRCDEVALQMAQMLCLIGSNAMQMENSCNRNSFPTSIVVHTKVAQGAIMPKIFVWDPGVFQFTTLRTRRLLRGRICHESDLNLLKIIIYILSVGPLVIVTLSNDIFMSLRYLLSVNEASIISKEIVIG